MSVLLRATGVLALALAIVACRPSAPKGGVTQRDTLARGTLAQVGGETISEGVVRRIAETRRLDAEAALDVAVSDALFAAEARRELGAASVRGIEASVLARAMMEVLRDEARARPVTLAEINALAAERWQDVDRPESARTVHAVVRFQEPSKEAEAAAVATRIAAAVAGTTQPEEFLRIAREVPHGALEVRVERLPPVTADGRTVGPGDQRFVQEFARAAHRLENPGDKSPPVRTEHGLHVIMLEERLPARRVQDHERRRVLEPVIYERRAAGALNELLSAARAATSTEISRAAGDLTRRVQDGR